MSDQLPSMRLPCDTEVGRLVVQVADGVPGDLAHQRHCRHCRQTLAELRALWELTAALAAAPVDVPDSVDDAVMRRIRRQVFVSEVAQLFGDVLPRLGRALLTYAGLIPRRGQP